MISIYALSSLTFTLRTSPLLGGVAAEGRRGGFTPRKAGCRRQTGWVYFTEE